MHPYHLAKLVALAGGMDSRKRVQKVVYLLQAAKCPLNAEFYLHHYGPYSTDVARALDQLVRADILKEERKDLAGGGRQYRYALTENGEAEVAALEAKPAGRDMKAELLKLEGLAKDLAGQPARPLEVASTIAYFYDENPDWNDAQCRAFTFKDVAFGSESARQAEELARRVLACGGTQVDPPA